MRQLNLWTNRHGSIHVNAFPSAHVATTLGESLMLLRLVPSAGVLFLAVVAGIAAGAVLRRYHYFVDILFGALLAAATVPALAGGKVLPP